MINPNEAIVLKCDLCRIRLVSDISKNVEEIELFDCTKHDTEQCYHCFHVRCLKQFL